MIGHYVGAFFAGAFLVNAIPHFVKGVCGDAFPTPFAKPPGKGLSSAPVNMVWALFNLAVGILLWHVSQPCGSMGLMATFAIGFVTLALMSAANFQKKDKE